MLLSDMLIDKARQGVEVRIIYDDVGCWNVKHRFFERMREEGIEVVSFLPVRFPSFANKVNYRNHRKLVIIDGRHPSFTPVQKAISYSMTSFFTTGGIRGGKAKLDKFYPRSYNMGIRRDVYLELGGFSKMRFGEDIDFSYRIVEAGHRPQLFPDAWVWHKRRTDFRKFFRQVYNSGIARINLMKRHPGTLKLVHLLPTVFTLGVIGCLLLSVFCVLALLPLLLYSLIIFVDSSIRNRSLWVGLLSIPAAFVQLMGYGFGFIESWWKRCILKQDEFQAFERTFYK